MCYNVAPNTQVSMASDDKKSILKQNTFFLKHHGRGMAAYLVNGIPSALSESLKRYNNQAYLQHSHDQANGTIVTLSLKHPP